MTVDPTKRKCRVCKLEKSELEFFRNSTRCRDCDRQYLRDWESRNREKVRLYWASSYQRNKENIQAGCRRWELNHPSAVTKLQHRRRSLLLSLFVEDVSISFLYYRDGGVCKLCNQFCDYEDASIDHIHPLSLGGEHSYKNTQLAHSVCNCRKRNKVLLN